MIARITTALALAAALVATYWGIYTAGSKAGAATVKQQWDRDTASRAMRTAEQNMKHRQAERALQAHAADQRKQKNAEINRIAAVHAAELDRLHNRPNLRATDRPGEPANPAQNGVGCTGAGLAKPDAAFLVGYAADAARLAAELKRCTTAYDAAEQALSAQNISVNGFGHAAQPSAFLIAARISCTLHRLSPIGGCLSQ